MKIMYQCDFCSKTFNTIKDTLKHINMCTHNPITQCCDSCKHFKPNNIPYDDFSYCHNQKALKKSRSKQNNFCHILTDSRKLRCKFWERKK